MLSFSTGLFLTFPFRNLAFLRWGIWETHENPPVFLVWTISIKGNLLFWILSSGCWRCYKVSRLYCFEWYDRFFPFNKIRTNLYFDNSMNAFCLRNARPIFWCEGRFAWRRWRSKYCLNFVVQSLFLSIPSEKSWKNIISNQIGFRNWIFERKLNWFCYLLA